MPFAGHVISLLWGLYLGVELLGHRVELYLALEDTCKPFCKVVIWHLYTAHRKPLDTLSHTHTAPILIGAFLGFLAPERLGAA